MRYQHPVSHPLGNLPMLTGTPPLEGKLRCQAEDFRVDEVPAYSPAGEGEHLFLRVRKTNLTTPDVVRRIARALNCDPRGAGWAGLKDKFAVTSQWLSFHQGDRAQARLLSLDGIEILEAAYHPHKLRTGHLRSNRFVLTVRDVEGSQSAFHSALLNLSRIGFPNYFAEQRFGRNNLEVAMSWLEGRRRVRARFEKKLLSSVVQSAVFNLVVAARVRSQTTDRAMRGDVFRKETTGGLFSSDAAADIASRLARFEISPTGPMIGPKMVAASGAAAELEEVARQKVGLSDQGRELLSRHAPGTRRSLRFQPAELEAHDLEGVLRLSFTLPKGCYATALVRELVREPRQTEEGSPEAKPRPESE